MYGGPQGQNTTQYWAGYTTIFRDTKQFYTVHNNISRYKTILLGAQQYFVMQNNFSRCTTIFRDTEQFYTVHNNFSWCKTIFHGAQQFFEIQNNFTVHNKLSRYKTIFHSAQQAFEIQNKFSRCTTSFRDAVDTYVEQNSVSRCKIKFHDAQQKFGRLVTSTGNFISRDHTTSCSLPPCFVKTAVHGCGVIMSIALNAAKRMVKTQRLRLQVQRSVFTNLRLKRLLKGENSLITKARREKRWMKPLSLSQLVSLPARRA